MFSPVRQKPKMCFAACVFCTKRRRFVEIIFCSERKSHQKTLLCGFRQKRNRQKAFPKQNELWNTAANDCCFWRVLRLVFKEKPRITDFCQLYFCEKTVLPLTKTAICVPKTIANPLQNRFVWKTAVKFVFVLVFKEKPRKADFCQPYFCEKRHNRWKNYLRVWNPWFKASPQSRIPSRQPKRCCRPLRRLCAMRQ